MSHDKIIDRIRKLLALSKSTNEHEAAMAAGQAADLMLKHEIEEAALSDAGDEPEHVTDETLDTGKQTVSWKSAVANGLCQSFGCRSYHHKRSGVSHTLIVGQPSKLATVRYMYAYLVAEIGRLADEAYGAEHRECAKSRVPAPSARAWKNAFRLGAAHVIYTRLVAQRKETHAAARLAGQGTALAVVKQGEVAVERYLKRKAPKLRAAPAPRYVSRDGFAAGKDAGADVSLGGGHGLSAGTKQLGGN